MKRAFTLIELLVVITIIAILAAILFPVFAQAKAAAQKTASLSNLKQLGTAAAIYTADHDDTFMATFVPSPMGGRWTTNYLQPAPADWVPGMSDDARNAAQVFWINNMRPYVKNEQIHRDPVAVNFNQSGLYVPATKPAGLPSYSYTYNGLLHRYSATAIASPSQLPLFWNGRGKSAMIGTGFVNPYLICPNLAEDCSYRPATGSTCATGNGGISGTSRQSFGTGYDVHARGVVMTFADSSAKTRRLGVFSSGNTDPFTLYNNSAFPTRTWYNTASACHSFMFRPDYDFQTPEPATSL
ncbi:MAG: prepilin-type N-terminal cleavage/methylation domain-containing protein [Fimbriimonadaceae bacterium]|nr:prepilin-type N-terminal cleavage/methylation domain-containing protein [Fimbriimonadaceae bacterium]